MKQPCPKNTRVILFSLLAVGLLFLAGCGRKAANDETTDQGAQDMISKVAKIVRNDEAVWPVDIPPDVPEFTQGRLSAAQKSVTAAGARWVMVVTDVEEGGFSAYADDLKSGGWEVTGTVLENSGTWSATREGFNLTLTFDGNKGRLTVEMFAS
jgi:hypothetical protein